MEKSRAQSLVSLLEEARAGLKEKVSELQEAQDLENEILQMNDRLQESENTVARLKRLAADHQKNSSKWKSRFDEMKTKHRQLVIDVAAISKQLEQLQRVEEELLHTEELLQKQARASSEIKQFLSKKDEEVLELKADLLNEKESVMLRDVMLKHLRSQLTEANESLEDCQKKLDAQSAELSKTKLDLRSREDQLQQMTSAKQLAEAITAMLQPDAGEHLQANANLENKVFSLEESVDRQKGSAKLAMEELARQLSETRRRALQLEHDLSEQRYLAVSRARMADEPQREKTELDTAVVAQQFNIEGLLRENRKQKQKIESQRQEMEDSMFYLNLTSKELGAAGLPTDNSGRDVYEKTKEQKAKREAQLSEAAITGRLQLQKRRQDLNSEKSQALADQAEELK
ncbi:hypothetical protein F5B21DRAFT_524670 [Xylaria acuta]|nr:hypothetical protein F5B21DRAFT_524670 [Xylaria acuta]